MSIPSSPPTFLTQESHQTKAEPDPISNESSPVHNINPNPKAAAPSTASQWSLQLHTHSYLTVFSILGLLSRLGLQSLTNYPGAPTIISSLWANFSGTLIMGYLSEEHLLFRAERGIPFYQQARERIALSLPNPEPEPTAHTEEIRNLLTAKKNHLAVKKSIPLYIGLATGYCGSLTSFSSFERDIFLALSNDLASFDHPTSTRHTAYSLLALLAVLTTTVAISLSAFHLGCHLAIFLEPIAPSLPLQIQRGLDILSVPLAVGCWLGAVLLAIWPPDEQWRGRVLFAIIFAPLGCFLRFHISGSLNGRLFRAFPLGTFAVNMLGTAILGLLWDLQHGPVGNALACQVYQGLMDGFCGCLTTVSTWAAELADGVSNGCDVAFVGSGLQRRRRKMAAAYWYGAATVLGGLALLVLIMGGLRWTKGFEDALCGH